MVGLSTAAAVIASQAMISGAFSVTRQAVQFGFFPRVTIVHTSGETEGQIYVPEVNWAMMIGCIALVVSFGESTGLAGAYGIAVTANMAITSLLYFFVLTRTWRWPVVKAAPLVALFLLFDLAYLGANLLKFVDGGWFPIVIALLVVTAMKTWRDGRAELRRRLGGVTVPLELFLKDVAKQKPHRVTGCAVFMTALPDDTPLVLLHHLKHNQVLHEQVVLLTIQSADSPTVPDEERLRTESLGAGFSRLFAQYGFMETPNVPHLMRLARKAGLSVEPATVSYYLGRETLLTDGPSGMMRWRKALFVFLSRNAQPATAYFGLPPGRVVELGAQIGI
jgi:KUP system potassium uptake protein